MQVLSNLVKNACESMQYRKLSSDRVLAISTETMTNTVAISISDTGIGVLKEDHTKIFRQGYTTKAGSRRFSSAMTWRVRAFASRLQG